jgi:hypothetical protein
MYPRDPAGHMIEVDWPDAATLAGSAFPELNAFAELKQLSDRVSQAGEALEAMPYLDRRKTATGTGPAG